MKTRIMIALLLAALVMTAACAGPAAPEAPAPTAAESQVYAPASESNAAPETPEAPPASGSEAESASTLPPAPAEGEQTGAEPDDLIAYLDPECCLPQIDADSPGAAAINEDIESRFGYLLGEDYCRLRNEWHVGFGGRVLSVLVIQEYDNDCTYYTPYNLDLTTGEWLTGPALLALLGVDEQTLIETETALMAGEFEYQYGSARAEMDPAFYDEQYERTAAPENAELERVWLGDGGLLMFAAKIYSLAGAEFYEYPMAAGYMFD